MRSFTDTALLEIGKAGEAARVEFKEAVSAGVVPGIRQAICAFANDLPDRAAAYYERGHAKSQLEEICISSCGL